MTQELTLTAVDWIIVAVYLTGCIVAGVWVKRYVRGVEDFAVAGREMDVNLGIASLAATEVGIVTVMYTAEMGFTHGFAGATPGVLIALAMFLCGLTGFVIQPLRRARVLTIPELFEKRFGKHVRWLAGLVVILGGLLNMGIFLRLGGEFLVHMTGLPPEYLEWTMTGLLLVVLVYTVLGGMISVLVTDYLQFLVMGLGIVVTSVLVLWQVPWSELNREMVAAHESAQAGQVVARTDAQLAALAPSPEEKQDASKVAQFSRQHAWREANAAELAGEGVLLSSKADEPVKPLAIGHPYDPIVSYEDSGGSPPAVDEATGQPAVPWISYGLLWVVWQAIFGLAQVTTWQTTIARVLAARSAESARKIYRRTAFYWVGRFGLPGLWGAAAFVYFSTHGGLPEGTDSLTAMPHFLGQILPWGVIGVVLAAMLAAEMSTDSGYLLTWATVIYNDIIGPLLRRDLSPAARLITIRAMVLVIGAFLVFYGLWYKLEGAAWDYLSVTGNIYLASLFTLLVAALYWKPANSWGALAAIVLGAVGPLSFLVLQQTVSKDSALGQSWLLSPAVAGLASFVMAFGGMVLGTALARMLGRGVCGPVGEEPVGEEEAR